MSIRCSLTVLALWICVQPVGAQITGEVLTIYRADATITAGPLTLDRALLSCGQTKAPTPTTTVTNPTTVRWDDPADGALDCVYLDATTGIVAALPTGATYYGTLYFAYDAGWTEPSAPSNDFTRTRVKRRRR